MRTKLCGINLKLIGVIHIHVEWKSFSFQLIWLFHSFKQQKSHRVNDSVRQISIKPCVMWFHLTVLMNCLPHWFHVIHIFLNLHHTYSHTRSHSYICTRYALTKHQTHNLSECIASYQNQKYCIANACW